MTTGKWHRGDRGAEDQFDWRSLADELAVNPNVAHALLQRAHHICEPQDKASLRNVYIELLLAESELTPSYLPTGIPARPRRLAPGKRTRLAAQPEPPNPEWVEALRDAAGYTPLPWAEYGTLPKSGNTSEPPTQGAREDRLPETTQTQMERAFGADFDNVAIHIGGPQATGSNRAVAQGEQISFQSDAFAPGTSWGDWLIAHELAHVVQQRAIGKPTGSRQALEADADQAAHAAMRGEAVQLQLQSHPQTALAFSDQDEHADPCAESSTAVPVENLSTDNHNHAANTGKQSTREAPSGNPAAEAQGVQDLTTSQPNTVPTNSSPVAKQDQTQGPPAQQADKAALQTAETIAQAIPADAQSGETTPEDATESDNAPEPFRRSTDSSQLPHPPTITSGVDVQFTDTDIDAQLGPRQPGESEEDRLTMTTAAQAEDATNRDRSREVIGGFVADKAAQIESLSTLADNANRDVDGASTTALAAITEQITIQSQAVRAQVAQVRAAAKVQAATLRKEISAKHTATLAAITTSTQAGRNQLKVSLDAALANIDATEQTQLTTVAGLYQRADGVFRAAGQRAGGEAARMGASRARQYRARKIHREDSALDGYLTDNRCEAQAEAAEKVGDGYRDELIKEAQKQLEDLRTRQPTDEAGVRSVAERARQEIRNAHQSAVDGLEAAHTSSIANAEKSKASLLAGVDSTLNATLSGLTKHKTNQLKALRERGLQQSTAIDTQATALKANLNQGVTQAMTGLNQGLQAMVQGLAGGPVPDPDQLSMALASADAQLSEQIATFEGQAGEQLAIAMTTIETAGQDGRSALTQIGQSATAAASSSGASFRQSMTTMSGSAQQSFNGLISGHNNAVTKNVDGAATGFIGIENGLTASYQQLAGNLEKGFQSNADSVEEGLTAVAREDLPGVISEEAQKARAQVQPRWKSVLKWVIIIAVVLVVAVVLGPMVIGAVTGLAAGLGASAAVAGVVGTVVGGALVGAATSAATTVIDNGFSGRDLTEGLGTAILLGAIGGAIGGAAAGPLRGLSGMAHFGASVAVDLVIDTGLNLATGNLSWENFGMSLFMSVLVNGVSAHGRVQGVQTRFTGMGHGAGFRGGRGARNRITGTGSAGSAGPIHIDSTHVHQGDTAGGGPYAGKWNMKGGGHSPGDIRARAAGDGYGNQTLATDPVTGVAIDQFSRPKLDNAGNPIPDPATPGQNQRITRRKSLYPESMSHAQIEQGGRTALEQALAGAPNTSHTPPPAPKSKRKVLSDDSHSRGTPHAR